MLTTQKYGRVLKNLFRNFLDWRETWGVNLFIPMWITFFIITFVSDAPPQAWLSEDDDAEICGSSLGYKWPFTMDRPHFSFLTPAAARFGFALSENRWNMNALFPVSTHQIHHLSHPLGENGQSLIHNHCCEIITFILQIKRSYLRFFLFIAMRWYIRAMQKNKPFQTDNSIVGIFITVGTLTLQGTQFQHKAATTCTNFPLDLTVKYWNRGCLWGCYRGETSKDPLKVSALNQYLALTSRSRNCYAQMGR